MVVNKAKRKWRTSIADMTHWGIEKENGDYLQLSYATQFYSLKFLMSRWNSRPLFAIYIFQKFGGRRTGEVLAQSGVALRCESSEVDKSLLIISLIIISMPLIKGLIALRGFFNPCGSIRRSDTMLLSLSVGRSTSRLWFFFGLLEQLMPCFNILY